MPRTENPLSLLIFWCWNWTWVSYLWSTHSPTEEHLWPNPSLLPPSSFIASNLKFYQKLVFTYCLAFLYSISPLSPEQTFSNINLRHCPLASNPLLILLGDHIHISYLSSKRDSIFSSIFPTVVWHSSTPAFMLQK